MAIVGKVVAFGIIAIALFSAGCCSVIKGTKQAVTFESNPEGAQVLIDGVSMGVTPLTTKLKKNAYDTIMIKKDGYATQTQSLEKKYDGLALVNIIWDLSTTDCITGAAYEYEPNKYYFELKKEENQ
jgi:hypothetical protein